LPSLIINVSMPHYMAKECMVTGKKSQVGGRYSNRTRATEFNSGGKKRRFVNLQKKTLYIPELAKSITIKVSTKALKTINKNGAYKTLKKTGMI